MINVMEKEIIDFILLGNVEEKLMNYHVMD